MSPCILSIKRSEAPLKALAPARWIPLILRKNTRIQPDSLMDYSLMVTEISGALSAQLKGCALSMRICTGTS